MTEDMKIDVKKDPVELLLNNSKYHDCYLTVGNPEIEKVKKIGVSSGHLKIHSPVFEEMLAGSELADPSGCNTHIKDVSPATFELMLRHVYGGKLPKITPEEAVELALCADKYDIQQLVERAAKRLNPKSADDVFPALNCAVYINCPELELQVTKVIQQQTDKIMKNPNFLEVNDNCIQFIVKQSILNICELDLWNNLVCWAEHQLEKYPKKTLRSFLQKALPYVRLATLSLEQITNHVLPTKILSSDEFMDLTLAVTKKETIKSPGICSFQEKRIIFSEDLNKCLTQDVRYSKLYTFKPPNPLYTNENKVYSTLTIETSNGIEIDTFLFKSLVKIPNNDDSFQLFDVRFYITIYTSFKGLVSDVSNLDLKGRAIPNQLIALSIKKSDGKNLVLEAKKMYTFKISTTPPMPVCKFINGKDDVTTSKQEAHGMTVKFEDLSHISEITYRVEE